MLLGRYYEHPRVFCCLTRHEGVESQVHKVVCGHACGEKLGHSLFEELNNDEEVRSIKINEYRDGGVILVEAIVPKFWDRN